MTALTLYTTSQLDATLTNAATATTSLGGAAGTNHTVIGTNSAWGELGFGGNPTWAGSGSPGPANGFGVIWDVTTLEGQTFPAGNWTLKTSIACTAASSSETGPAELMVYKWNSGTFTLLGTGTLASATYTPTPTAVSVVASLSALSFHTGDKLYWEVWFDSTAHTGTPTNMTVSVSTSLTLGFAGAGELDTPGFSATLPALSTTPGTLNFSAPIGGSNPDSQNSTLSETNGVTTAWTSNISYGVGSGWLAISPISGSLAASGNQVVSFTCTTGSLTAGTYTATVTFTATTGGATAVVNVNFVVSTIISRRGIPWVGVTHQIGANFPNNSNILTWLADLQLQFVRIQTTADSIWLNQNDDPSVWSWSAHDAAVNVLLTNGYIPVITLQKFPTWCTDGGIGNIFQATDEPYNDPGTFSNTGGRAIVYYAQQVANRYNGIFNIPTFGPMRVNYIGYNEDWNLHTTPGGFHGIRSSPFSPYNAVAGTSSGQQPGRDPQYAALVVSQVYNAIKQAGNQYVGSPCVLWRSGQNDFSGSIGNAFYFTYGMVTGHNAGNTKPVADWLDVHFYSATDDPSVNQNPGNASLPYTLQQIRAAQLAGGHATKTLPIWLTEFGWSVPGDCTDAVQGTRFQYVLNTWKQFVQQTGGDHKLFFYTLDANGASTDPKSLQVWNGTGYTPSTAYGVVKTFIANNPSLL